jgi:hypothetical protein
MITAGLTNSFKQQLLLAVHDFSVDTIKIALYTSAATLDGSTTVYSTLNETSGTGYTAGGEILTGVTVTLTGSIAYVSFNNPTWNGSSFTTRGALLYNFSKSNKSIGVLNFGVNQTTVTQQFQIQFPPNNADNALIRIN